MLLNFSRRTVGSWLFGGALLAAGLGLLLWPKEVVDAGREGLALCGSSIIPSLFPFFVLSTLIVQLGVADAPGRLLQKVMWALFRVSGNGASALLLGLIGGYPVGGRTVAELYRQGSLSYSETQRLLAFCNNSGPAFLLGVVGVGVFGSPRIGALLCAIHILSALLVGVLFRFRGRPSAPAPVSIRPSETRCSGLDLFLQAVQSSAGTLLNVCAFVMLFSVIIRLLMCSGLLRFCSGGLAVLGVDRFWAERLLCGVIELSNGVAALPGTDLANSLPLAAFFLGWGGISVHCQTISILHANGLGYRTYLLGKGVHGLISAGLAVLALRLWPGAAACGAWCAPPLLTGFQLPPLARLAASCALCFILLALFLYIRKKRAGNPHSSKL